MMWIAINDNDTLTETASEADALAVQESQGASRVPVTTVIVKLPSNNLSLIPTETLIPENDISLTLIAWTKLPHNSRSAY